MNNIFRIGGQVSGESFIGRKNFIANIRKNFIDSKYRTCKSIIGLTRTGKTSTIKYCFQDLPDNILYVYEDLNERSNYQEIWQDICAEIQDQMDAQNISYNDLSNCFESLYDPNLPWIKLCRNVKKIFSHINDLDIKTILVLDEFDKASDLFNEGTKHFELFRTIFSDSKFNVSAITISRRNLYTIEGATYQSSTFHGVLDIIPFKGFDNEDLNEYFEIFNSLGIKLDEQCKQKIVYYSGNAPYLLSILGHYIIEEYNPNQSLDIDKIFFDKCKAINDYYRDYIKHLERDNDLKRIVPFVIGPNIGVTQNDKDELINLGYFREEHGKLIAISGYFVDFLSANMLSTSIWENIISLEKKLKNLVQNEIIEIIKYMSAGGNSYNEIYRAILEKIDGINDSTINKYDSYIDKNKKQFNIESNYLDVMSLADTVKIIKSCWMTIFSYYFNDDSFNEWEYKLNKCSKARNPVAHGHEEYLSDNDKKEIDAYCKQIFDLLAQKAKDHQPNQEQILLIAKQFIKSNLDDCKNKELKSNQVNNIVDDNKSTSNASNYTSKVIPRFLNHRKIPDPTLIGKTIEMYITNIGGFTNPNLHGTIQDEKYKAVIPKNYLNNIDLQSKIGKTISVTVESISKDLFIVRPNDNWE